MIKSFESNVLTSLKTGLKVGNCNNPCFMCDWQQDMTRKKDRPKRMKYDKQANNPRASFVQNQLGVKGRQLVTVDKILFAPLHIKLGLFSQFICSLPDAGKAKTYLKIKYKNNMSSAKIDNGAGFDGSMIRKLFKDENFKKQMNRTELAAWLSLISVSQNFLGNNRSFNYKQIVSNLIKAFEAQGIKETVKLHFLRSHLDSFPINCGQLSDEQGERFHQEICAIERRYQGRCNKHMLAEYVWGLKHESDYVFGFVNNF